MRRWAGTQHINNIFIACIRDASWIQLVPSQSNLNQFSISVLENLEVQSNYPLLEAYNIMDSLISVIVDFN